MKVQNYPKWKETTIGDIPFFTSMILGGRVWLCDIFSMIQFYYKLQHEKSVRVRCRVRPRDPESCGSILRPSCSHPRMFLIQNEDEEGHMRRGKTFKTSQNETIHAMVIWNNSQHGSCNLVSFKPLEFCIPTKSITAPHLKNPPTEKAFPSLRLCCFPCRAANKLLEVQPAILVHLGWGYWESTPSEIDWINGEFRYRFVKSLTRGRSKINIWKNILHIKTLTTWLKFHVWIDSFTLFPDLYGLQKVRVFLKTHRARNIGKGQKLRKVGSELGQIRMSGKWFFCWENLEESPRTLQWKGEWTCITQGCFWGPLVLKWVHHFWVVRFLSL